MQIFEDITFRDSKSSYLKRESANINGDTSMGTMLHMGSTGSQVPFSSKNYGMNISPEGRLVTRSVLLAHEAGLDGGEMPIFPIHCFRVCDGVNGTKGDPN